MRKLLSLLLAVMMVLTMLPVAAFADELELFPVGEAPVEEEPTAEAPAEEEKPTEEPAEPEQPEEEEFIEEVALFAAAPASSGAPAASVGNNFVEEIYFPVSSKKSLNDKLERIQGFEFDKNSAVQDVVLPEIVGNMGPAAVYWGITISEDYAKGTFEELHYQVYFNGVLKTKTPVKLKATMTRVQGMMYMKDIAVGKMSTMTIVVGTLDSTKTSFTYSDVYEFHITRQASIKTLSVTAADQGLSISPIPDWTENPYVRDYYVVTPEDKVTLNINASTGAKILVGTKEIPAKTDSEIDLTEFRSGESSSKLPITIIHDSGEVKSETTYNLYISKNDYTPVITAQPQNVVTEKNEENPISVEVSAEGNGTVTYQWYSIESTIARPVEGATEPTFRPSRDYAGQSKYYCLITNTVDGIPYMIKSETVTYEVKLTYLTAPYSYIERTIGSTFYTNGRPILVTFISNSKSDAKCDDIGDAKRSINVKLYRTDKNEAVGGVLVGEADTAYMESSGYEGFEIMLEPQSILGTYYYYSVVTVSVAGYEDAVGITEPVGILFKPLDKIDGLKGSGSASDPFMLYSQEDLEYIKSLAEGKNGEPFDCAGQTFAFANDIHLSKDWEPIGGLKEDGKEDDNGISLLPFAGTIDGKGHTLIIEDHGKCLIKYARNATVKNLNIKGEHIDGYGLVEKYVVDYGTNGSYGGQHAASSRTIDIDNVTIKSGTKILMSGFLGGYASGANNVNITNCVVEKGVTIGDDGSWGDLGDTTYGYAFVGNFDHKDNIGSFAGAFNGTITNCVSYATVYGKDNVGGLVGMKGQSMGSCDIENSAFLGKIVATGEDVGGIVGSGYNAGSAPGTPMVQIHNCYVAAEIIGNDKVGGIVGAEAGHRGNVDEGDVYGVRGTVSISNNHFYGKITGNSNVGGVAGYFYDFTKKIGEATNFFVNTCGTNKAIGGVAEGNEIVGEELFGLALSEEEFANGTVTAKLNSNLDEFAAFDYAEWLQAANYPAFVGTAEAVEAVINAIGKVELTSACQSKINAARKAYDELNDSLKQYVSNYQELLDAENDYFDLVHADDEPIHIVIGAATNAAANGEENPNTGAEVLSIAPVVLVLKMSTLK